MQNKKVGKNRAKLTNGRSISCRIGSKLLSDWTGARLLQDCEEPLVKKIASIVRNKRIEKQICNTADHGLN